jgi:hypothetical protein
MNINCNACGVSLWVGLVYCTQCGVELKGLPPAIDSDSRMRLVFDGEDPCGRESGEVLGLFPVFGDLLVASDRSPPSMLELDGESVSVRRLKREWRLPDFEVVSVGRWLVLRAGEELAVTAAPLLRTPHLESAVHTLASGAAATPPSRVAAALGEYGAGGAATIARLAAGGRQYLAHIVGESDNSVVRVLDIGTARLARPPTEAILEKRLPGAWLFDKGGRPGSDRLVLHSPDRVGVLQLTAGTGDVVLELCNGRTDQVIVPTSTVLTDEELLFLVGPKDGPYKARAWELTRPNGGIVETRAPQGRSIDGIEPWIEGPTVGAVARVGTRFYRYESDSARFSAAPVAGLEINSDPPSTPGAVVYQDEARKAVRVRFVDADLELPSERPLERANYAVEGGRVWAFGHRGGERRLQVFDRDGHA